MTKEQRSSLMARVKGKNTKPELIVRKYLFSEGFRYRLHDRRYPGTPDIFLPKYKTAIFVHGCFWHGHDRCKYARLPDENRDYWETKIDQNKTRDVKKIKELEQLGWNVIVVWECEIKRKTQRTTRLEKLKKEILDNGLVL